MDKSDPQKWIYLDEDMKVSCHNATLKQILLEVLKGIFSFKKIR